MTDDLYAPPDAPLRLIHQSAHLVLFDKPSGLLTVPGKGAHLADCLIARVRRQFPAALLVHRLDRDTSGLVVFALTHAAQRDLNLQFEQRRTTKTYVARVWGQMAVPEGRVDLPLTVDWPNRPLQHVNHETGRPAVTDWLVVDRGNGETRVRLMPLTGRSHQLRVHMQAIGHPILGDPFYASGPARDFPRLMLHAESLGFRDPGSGESVSFSAPCPF